MKNYKSHKQAFTLIEILISMAIFAMIMISVMMIYITASDISKKYDINREMRNNIKSVVEDIAEEVRKNDIEWIAEWYWDPFIFDHDYWKWKWIWTRLKLKDWPEYRLVKYNKWILTKYDSLNIAEKKWQEHSWEDCSSITDMCRIVKFDKNWVEIWPLSNSKVSFTNLSFTVSWENEVPKVLLNFIARASVKEWIRTKLAEKTTLIFQTSFSERALKVK